MRIDVGKQVGRMEQLEVELTIFNARRALSAVEKHLEVKKIGECTLLIDPNSPHSIYYNRIKGFGPDDLDKLDEILQQYQEKGLTPCIDMAPNRANEEVARLLAARGYVSAEQLAFLQFVTPQEGMPPQKLRIEKVTKDNVDALMNIISLSMGGVEQDIIDRKKAYFYQPHFLNFIVYVGEDAAGMGSLFTIGKEGYIANDFTFPQFRGKGCQTALLQHRIKEAQELGLERLYTDVEFGSVSHNNMLKIGFTTVFVNSFWIKL